MQNDEIISPGLRISFREFCSSCLVLRKIRDLFEMGNVPRGTLPSDSVVSGERRTLVLEYYASINWRDSKSVGKFLTVLSFALAQTYVDDTCKKELRAMILAEGLTIDDGKVRLTSGIQQSSPGDSISHEARERLMVAFTELHRLEPKPRGFAFERFLRNFFAEYGLDPRPSFRLIGEQIDGSFQFDRDTYLLEAKWENPLTPQEDLLVFRGKVEAKSAWSRGLFISYSGFSPDGLEAFAKGRPTNIIGMDGRDIHLVLSGDISFADAVDRKARKAAEEGVFFVSLFSVTRKV